MTFSSPRIFKMTLRKLSACTPTLLSSVLVAPTSAKACITQSVDKNSSPAFCFFFSAKFSALTASELKLTSPVGFVSVGASASACFNLLCKAGKLAPACCNKLRLEVSSNNVDKI